MKTIDRNRINCNLELSQSIQKSIETMLDGSEEALLQIDQKQLRFQTVDALGICMCLFIFDRSKFFYYCVLGEGYSVRFKLRPVHEFLKHLIKPTTYSFIITETNLEIHTAPSFGRIDQSEYSHIFVPSSNNIVYYRIPARMLVTGACFQLDPDIFVDMILRLSIGSGYINLQADANQLTWSTVFETGNIVISITKYTVGYTLLRPFTTPFCFQYLAKFLKQSCSIAATCKVLYVHLPPEGNIILQFITEHSLGHFTLSIIPS